MKNASLLLLFLTLMFGCKKDEKPTPEPKPETREYTLIVGSETGTNFTMNDPIDGAKQYKGNFDGLPIKKSYNVGQKVDLSVIAASKDMNISLRVFDVKNNKTLFEKQSKEFVSYSFTVN